MFRVPWSPIALLFFSVALASPTHAQSKISGRWLGQDGQDHCGADVDAVKPNGYQDVHIALSGLPPRLEIVSARLLGFGSGEWQYKCGLNRYGAVILRKARGLTADVYFEPDRVETGRPFTVALKFDNGTEVNVDVKGGKADPNLRMPAEAMTARWVGQERTDHAGSGPGVGPDGFRDVRVALARLTPRTRLVSILVEDSTAARWAFGINREGHPNAEFFTDAKDPTQGDLYFQPDRDLSGHKLKVTVAYEGGKKDSAVVVAGRSDPKLAMTRALLPKLSTVSVTSRWLGQDGSAVTGRGNVHVRLSGLPVGRPVVTAVLSDSVCGVWAYRAASAATLDGEGDAAPLGFRVKGANAEMDFAPLRDESKASLTLRLIYADGESSVATIPGGACDPFARAPEVEKTEAVARPGDDLNGLVNRVGTVRLTRGEYRLDKPLVLNRPVTLVGDRGATLMFAQAPGDAPWTAALKIHSGGTTLRGFAVRFAGPVRWRNDVNWGPAVIGTTDNFDATPTTLKFHLTLDGLDIEGPAASGKTPWEEAVKLMRLNYAVGGRVTGNVLRGGVIEVFGGPWRLADNDYRGTPAGTFAYSVFAVHDPHDLVVKNNKARPVGPGGKVWRFLVLTGRGSGDRVEDNTVERVGPRDDDTMTGYNSPEIILTESYHLCFEGKPAAISNDGRVVKIGPPRGVAPRTGDVVSVVSGTGTGTWRRIAQRIEPTTYYLDAPLPKGSEILSISPGFIDGVYAGNTVDARNGRGAGCLVLAGNHFGTRVTNNRFVGAGDAFRLVAFPSETPNIWGWSHVPFLGGVVEGNVIEDSERGGSVGVDHGPAVKTNKGRVYMTVSLKNNVVRWSEAFLKSVKETPPGITLGVPGSADPGELVVTESGDRLEAPARALKGFPLRVNAALLNGQACTARMLALPAPNLTPPPAPGRATATGR